MKDDIFISVVMSTYNVEKFIRFTIESVLNQNFKNIEILITDDGSTDSTIEILDEFQKKYININVFFEKHTGNIGMNLNKCIRNAKGNVIAIIGADDYWYTDKLKTELKYYTEDTMICSNANVINEKNEVIYEQLGSYKKNFWVTTGDLLNENIIVASSVIASKKLFLKAGLFNEVVGNKSEDYFLWIKVSLICKIFYLNEILVGYRVHGENLSLKSNMDKISLMNRNIDILLPYVFVGNIQLSHAASIGISKLCSRIANLYLKEGKLNASLMYIKKYLIFCTNRFNIKHLKILIAYLFINIKIRLFPSRV